MRPALLLAVFAASSAFAQIDRYELGRRVHDFELTWDEKVNDAAAKKRAVPLVNQAVQSFLKLRISDAAQNRDAARHALESAEAAPANVRWAEALQVVPESRSVDASMEEISVIVKPFYKVNIEAPKHAMVRAKLGAGKP